MDLRSLRLSVLWQVGNVCERSALKGAGTSRLLIRKTAHNGVTVAAAVKDYTVCMED